MGGTLAGGVPGSLVGDSTMAASSRPRPAVAVAAAARRFLAVEAAGGILLVAATVAALAWANSPWQASYLDLWSTEAVVDVGGTGLSLDLRHWVNDGLMALFFLVVGLEIRREATSGELRDRRTVALPVVAALGGMVVPAAVYVAVNAGGPGAAGWGVPMATDIAFALGVVALLGRRVPSSLRLLLLTLAVVDDIGAILVIAVVYTDHLEPAWLLAAAAGVVAMVVLHRLGVRGVPFYVVAGVLVWFATHESGVHATIAGAVLGLVTPAREGQRVEEALHPIASYVVVPLFALANAGVVVTADGLADAATSAVTLGVVAGLVLGKLAGVTGGAWLATRLGVATLPDGVRWPQVAGIGAVAGIGFTVSLFVAGLAFDDQALADQAVLGVLAASVVAALVGAAVLAATGQDDAAGPSGS